MLLYNLNIRKRTREREREREGGREGGRSRTAISNFTDLGPRKI